MIMTEPKIELFSTLQSLSESVPEMRVGQLLAALGELCSDMHGRGLWVASDEELLEAVWNFRTMSKGWPSNRTYETSFQFEFASYSPPECFEFTRAEVVD